MKLHKTLTPYLISVATLLIVGCGGETETFVDTPLAGGPAYTAPADINISTAQSIFTTLFQASILHGFV